jgi:multimeric flavodoxin WrbA
MEKFTGMRVVGISGSPRKGNTEWMLRKLLEEVARSGIETELIYLREMKIRGCDGCLSCESGGQKRRGVCRIQDDMQQIYPKLIEADGLALGTPVYFKMLSGLLKNFIDRTSPIRPKLKEKPVVGIAVAEKGIGKAVNNLRTYASVCRMRWVGYVTALAKTPKQVSKDKGVERRLERLARKLINMLTA